MTSERLINETKILARKKMQSRNKDQTGKQGKQTHTGNKHTTTKIMRTKKRQ